MRPYLSLILPAYNEARVIPTTIGEAVAYFDSCSLTYEIIVSADGDDGYHEIVRNKAEANHALTAHRSEQRRGKGLGIRNADALAQGRFIGYADADNKVPIAEFDKVRPLLEAGAQAVIGSRRGGAK